MLINPAYFVMQRIILLVICSLCLTFPSAGQVLYKTIDFKIGTPYLEPDGRDLTLKINDNEFISLAKSKGGIFGESVYQLEKYNREMEVLFSVPLKFALEEDFFKLFLAGDRFWLFSVVHNTRTFTTQCKVYEYSVTDGTLLGDKILNESKVNPWSKEMSKASVEESFQSAINSCQPRDFVTPLEYNYQVQFSPDNRKFIVYIYDYSQKYLVAQAAVYDTKLELLFKGIVPIDNNFVNYGLYINNRAELFILNADRMGRIALIRYNMETKDNVFLDIASSASKRYNFKLKFLNDDEVYVVNLSSKSNKLAGFMYSKFNFKEKAIDKINHQELSEGIVQTSKALRTNNKEYDAEDDWLNYNISDVYLNEFEKIIVVLEKQQIISTMFNYQPGSVNNIDNWYEKTGRVNTGPVILYAFNNEDVLLWETYHLKDQSNDITAGMLSASHAMTITADGKILMTYASSSNASGQYNEINYLLFEESSGSKIKNIKLDNKESLSVLKDYTVWFDNAVIMAARKGLFGKKSNMIRYNYNVE
ncbi:MAG TPA: hypothetical protein VK750_00175 [Cytophagaceae bacterium]|jgi:hypothetical protein|nr:hypothetical protein [Cytophagaceae bacterium]